MTILIKVNEEPHKLGLGRSVSAVITDSSSFRNSPPVEVKPRPVYSSEPYQGTDGESSHL